MVDTETVDTLPVMNILTRTGKRPALFKALSNSIKTQTYHKVRHIKSCDNPACDYLEDETDVIPVTPERRRGKGFYNLYLNTLADNVAEGWVIILDDDSIMTDNSFIEILANECSKASENEILLYQSNFREKKHILPPANHRNHCILKIGFIDMACFCVHHTVLKKERFGPDLCGDFKLLRKLKNKGYPFRGLQIPIGTWANYAGKGYGK